MAGHHRFKAPPQAYAFSVRDQRTFAKWFWRCPQRLVLGGVWRDLWRAEGTKRGGGLASAVLPILALHHFKPGKEPASVAPHTGWTAWGLADAHHALSHRRIAALAGIDKTSVRTAIARLEALRLVESKRVAPPAHTGGADREVYRLSLNLFPVDRDEWYAEIGGTLLYGGAWSILPSHAARHLYVVIAALDAVANEDAFVGATDEYGRDVDDEERAEILADYRRKHPLSISDLTYYAGFTSNTTTETALKLLTAPLLECDGVRLPLVDRGEARGRMSWFAPSRQTAALPLPPSVLNDAAEREQFRHETFPTYALARWGRSAAQQRAARRQAIRLAAPDFTKLPF